MPVSIAGGRYTTLTLTQAATMTPFGQNTMPRQSMSLHQIAQPPASLMTIKQMTFDVTSDILDRSNSFTYWNMPQAGQLKGECSFSGFISASGMMNLQIGLFYSANIAFNNGVNAKSFIFQFLLNSLDYTIAVDDAYKIDISGTIFPTSYTTRYGYYVPASAPLDNNASNRSYAPTYQPATVRSYPYVC